MFNSSLDFFCFKYVLSRRPYQNFILKVYLISLFIFDQNSWQKIVYLFLVKFWALYIFWNRKFNFESEFFCQLFNLLRFTKKWYLQWRIIWETIKKLRKIYFYHFRGQNEDVNNLHHIWGNTIYKLILMFKFFIFFFAKWSL